MSTELTYAAVKSACHHVLRPNHEAGETEPVPFAIHHGRQGFQVSLLGDDRRRQLFYGVGRLGYTITHQAQQEHTPERYELLISGWDEHRLCERVNRLERFQFDLEASHERYAAHAITKLHRQLEDNIDPDEAEYVVLDDMQAMLPLKLGLPLHEELIAPIPAAELMRTNNPIRDLLHRIIEAQNTIALLDGTHLDTAAVAIDLYNSYRSTHDPDPSRASRHVLSHINNGISLITRQHHRPTAPIPAAPTESAQSVYLTRSTRSVGPAL